MYSVALACRIQAKPSLFDAHSLPVPAWLPDENDRLLPHYLKSLFGAFPPEQTSHGSGARGEPAEDCFAGASLVSFRGDCLVTHLGRAFA